MGIRVLQSELLKGRDMSDIITAKRKVFASVWGIEVRHTGPSRCEILRMWRFEDGTVAPQIGEITFAQIERPREGGQVVVAVVMGPMSGQEAEPDWAFSVLLAVDNPKRASDYGGTAAWHTYGRIAGESESSKRQAPRTGAGRKTAREGLSQEEVAKREKACEASRKSRLRRELRGQGKPEDEIKRLVP